jgi:hypothetical protein
LRAKVPAPVNLAFNGNIEKLSLIHMNMESDCLSTLKRTLSTVNTSNHIHHLELHVDPPCSGNNAVDWAGWEEVYSLLAGYRFQFLQELYIHIGYNVHDRETVIETSRNMVAAHPSLGTRGARVSPCELKGSLCLLCWDSPWLDVYWHLRESFGHRFPVI